MAVSEGNGGEGKVRITEADSELGEVEIEPRGDKSYAGERVRDKRAWSERRGREGLFGNREEKN